MAIKLTGLGILLLGISQASWALTTDDAQKHFTAIAEGNMSQIMQDYADNATLHWIGGPLNGSYQGKEKLLEVWGKFSSKNAPANLKVLSMEESRNPAGSTISAKVIFKADKEIKVRYVLVYRDGKLVNEIWQIDPALM